jgi:heavy metal sensor kinase
MNTRSIHFRLILWYSGLVILVSLAFGAAVYQGVRSRLYANMEQTFTRRAHRIADNILVHSNDKSQPEIAYQIDSVYSPAANNRFIRILNKERSLFYLSPAPKDSRFNPGNISLPLSLDSALRTEALAEGGSLFIVDVPVTSGGKSFLIEMGAPMDSIYATLESLIIILLSGLPLMILVVSAGGYVLVKRSLKPVEAIRVAAEQITFGNLSGRLPVVKTGDELEYLSLTLNQMLERLENAYQQLSQFSADASHELRTPLTIMRGELESITQREAELPVHLRERLASVLEEAERLSRITENLFAISRLDAGEARIEPITFYLVDLVKTTTDQMLLLAEEKAIEIKVNALHPAKVRGDEARLKQVVVNLLDNAIKYTPDGGDITITVSIFDHKAVLTITDTGIGIPTEALPHIFERFYRADKVRSREQGGAGLGLAIVRAICQAHGGTVEIESTEHKGTTCRVILPLANGET